VFNLCVLLLLNMIMITYNISVVRTIEKRFSLTSTQTGLTWSMNDVTHICLVTFVAYFAQKSHKPRVLSVTMSFSAVAACLMVLPYLVYPRAKKVFPSGANSSLDILQDYCVPSSQGYSHDSYEYQCDEDLGVQQNKGAWYIFLFAQLINGVGGTGLQTLGLAYIDENVPKSQSGIYVGKNSARNLSVQMINPMALCRNCHQHVCFWSHHWTSTLGCGTSVSRDPMGR
jgi:MFS family permease